MKTTSAALTFFLLTLNLDPATNVWAKLGNNVEEHRELNHESSRNHFQSKLKNKGSGKCLGFHIANDVDDGEKAEWVNCKRAPTFTFQNPKADYFDQSSDDLDEYSGLYYHLTFQVGSLSESSSTSDHRSYMCLSTDEDDDLDVVIAKYCSADSKQWWYPLSVRGKKDTWRFLNRSTRGVIEYKEKVEEKTFGHNSLAIKEEFNLLFDVVRAVVDNVEAGHPDMDFDEQLLEEQILEAELDNINRRRNSARKLAEATMKNPNPRSITLANTENLVEKAMIDEAKEGEATPIVEGELMRHKDDIIIPLESQVSANGTIVEFFSEFQHFVDLDCRFVYGENPIRDDGWYDGFNPESNKPLDE